MQKIKYKNEKDIPFLDFIMITAVIIHCIFSFIDLFSIKI